MSGLNLDWLSQSSQTDDESVSSGDLVTALHAKGTEEKAHAKRERETKDAKICFQQRGFGSRSAEKTKRLANQELCRPTRQKNLVIRYEYNEYMRTTSVYGKGGSYA